MTNAEAKRAERQRKRDAGLVPKEVWIRPQYNDKLRKMEAEWRKEPPVDDHLVETFHELNGEDSQC